MQAHKPFLSYTGEWEEVNEKIFNFTYDGKIQINSDPIFIVPPIYDITFETIFSHDEEGMKSVKDFLNSILFPSSHSILDIQSFASNTNAFIAKVKDQKNKKEKEVKAVRESAEDINVFEGRVCSGDQFISKTEQKEKIISDFGGMCCEMEGAAIAQACYLNDTPFVIIRAISDKPDETEIVEYKTFEAEAAERCAKIVKSIVANL